MSTFEEAEIAAMLAQSAAAWTAGDLDAFLACYDDSPDTLYVNSTNLVTGFAAIRSMYIERFGGAFPGPAHGTTRGGAPGTMLGTTRSGSLGQLSLTLLRSTRIGPEHMFVVGRYSLLREADHGVTTTNGVSTANGVFSLVLRKTPAGWRIT